LTLIFSPYLPQVIFDDTARTPHPPVCIIWKPFIISHCLQKKKEHLQLPYLKRVDKYLIDWIWKIMIKNNDVLMMILNNDDQVSTSLKLTFHIWLSHLLTDCSDFGKKLILMFSVFIKVLRCKFNLTQPSFIPALLGAHIPYITLIPHHSKLTI